MIEWFQPLETQLVIFFSIPLNVVSSSSSTMKWRAWPWVFCRGPFFLRIWQSFLISYPNLGYLVNEFIYKRKKVMDLYILFLDLAGGFLFIYVFIYNFTRSWLV